MKHDPHYGQIINRLNGDLDPDVFERCVPDLLRRHDGLFAVPIKGGSDSGMDGAVADGHGEPIPIVSTISDRVSENMNRNLKKYIREGGIARTCIVATSRSLTPRRQKNLTNKARELGFTLLPVLEQSGIAARLYHDSKWCKELLHLTGKPSALSVIPRTSRPILANEIIGREDAKQWIRTSSGNRLIVGDPGVGKTSLLYDLAINEDFRALFLVSSEMGEIANAIRDQQPKIIMVDDAHADVEFLTELARLKREIHADFEILATSWKGEQKDIEHVLDIEPRNVLMLARLKQAEIAEIIVNSGISDHHWLVNEIVRQAGGLPGLAGTLTYFALQGRWREIYTGDALATDITRFYKNRITGDVAGLLACFAIGGKSGMAKGTVSTALNMPILQLRQDLSNLAHGGIIAEVPYRTDFIKVRPPALRHALIRDIFFSGPSALPESVLQGLLAAVPEHVDTVRELIDVTRRWEDVPQSLIQTPLKKLIEDASRWLPRLPLSPLGHSTPSLEAVREYAWLGPEEANWAMDNFTASLSHIARPLLENVPKRVIPLLLSEAVGDTRSLHSNTEHPLRLLQDWIKQAHPGTEEPVQRRARILHIAKSWLSGGHDPAIGYGTMLLAVIPTFEFSEHQPGGDGIRIFSGFLNQEHLLRLQEFWNVIANLMRVVAPTDWDEHFTALGQWAFPMDCPNDDTREILTAFGETMVLDIVSAVGGNVALLHRLKAFTIRAYPHLEIVSDPVVNTLYPILNFEEDQGAQEKKWKEAVSLLAKKWSNKEPAEVISLLEPIERDLLGVHGILHRYTGYLCQLLSQSSAAPLTWFTYFLDSGLPADTVIPFLLEAVEQKDEGWENALRAAFDTDELNAHAVSIILTTDDVALTLKSEVLRDADQYPDLIAQLVRSNQLSEAAALELYKHPDKLLVSKVVLAQWKQKDRDEIPSWIRPQWEEAIVNHVTADHATFQFIHVDYWLERIFANEPELGTRWLQKRFKDDSFTPFRFAKSIASAIAGMSAASRQRLLELIPDGYLWRDTAALLVGDSPDLFQKLLQSPRNELDVLAPLSRPAIDSIWMKFAKLASQHGFPTGSIVSHAFSDFTSWSGNFSDVSKSRYEQFEPFLTGSDVEVQRIAKAGRDYFFSEYESWRNRERDEEVFGRE